MRRLLGPGLMTLAMLAILIGLGTWQVYRLHWKEGILAQVAQAEAAPAVPLTGNPGPYEKVAVTGTLRADLSAYYAVEVRDTRAGPVLGTYLVQPLERPGQPPLLVERGWIPEKPIAPIAQPQGPTTIVGYVRAGSSPGLFSATDNPVRREFYTLDPTAIGTALGLPHVEPFILVALGPASPNVFPDPAQHLPRPPNNHLYYAATWYGLAGALVVIFAGWAKGTLSA